MLVLRCLLLLSRLVSQAELYRWLLTWKLNLTGLIYFTSGYFGKNTSAPSKDFSLAPVLCQARLLWAAKLTEAGFLWISLPRPAYPPSSFLHPGAMAPSRGFPRCPGVPRAERGHPPLLPRAAAAAGAPLQRVQFSSPCPPGRPRSSLPRTATRFRFWTRSVTCQ